MTAVTDIRLYLWARLRRWWHCLTHGHRPVDRWYVQLGTTDRARRWIGCGDCDRVWVDEREA